MEAEADALLFFSLLWAAMVCYVVWSVAVGMFVAHHRNRNGVLWALLALVLSPWLIFPLAIGCASLKPNADTT